MKAIATTFLLLVFAACAVRKQAEVMEFPPEMGEPVRVQFREAGEKGRILYELNCAACHDQTVKGKHVIPDFTADALKGYEIRVSNKMHEENMPDEKVTAEELGLISVFLTYKKKSGVPVRLSAKR